MVKQINREKLERLFKHTITKQLDKAITENTISYENPVYYDGRQYSLNIPARLFDFIEYHKGDKIKFTIDLTDPDKPKIRITYLSVRE